MKKLLILFVVLAVLVLAGWGSFRLYRAVTPKETISIPTAAVRRGDVSFEVYAKGELVGGNSEMLTVPMVASSSLVVTFLRESGELVEEGDVVAQLDTTEQEFNLKEAEADLAEAEQQVIQAQANAEATAEDARLALLQARGALKQAELEVRKNPFVSPIIAKENDLALEAARERVATLEKDLPERIATAKAGIAIQAAGQMKAKMAADMARRNIESMTLKAKTGGYVSRQQNTGGMFFYISGMSIPTVQTGDTVRAGMPLVQIPDMKDWVVSARMSELDRAHIAVDQKATITVVALPGRTFTGRVLDIGGVGGAVYDRYFQCRIGFDNPVPELRPGMSARAIITTTVMKNVLWIRSQALFDSGGRKFVYVKTGESFTPVDVKLVQRSESQAVIEGLKEGQLVALASPDQMKQQVTPASGGAMGALPK
jgi:multidrug efflux pump subunit AcrA (membrane-fusion protein)